MSLFPVLAEMLNAALLPAPQARFTTRDARLPLIPGKIHSVIGMRRSGKTTFLRQLQAERRLTVPPEQAIYLGFDDDRLDGIGTEQLDFLLEEYFRAFPALRGDQTCYWLLDEVQNVEGWDRFARRLLDTERIELVVSGSSAKLLSREVHTSLRGRGMATVIRPFSFREYMRHRGEEPLREPARWTPADRSLVESRFREYLVEGGFPEAQGLAPAPRIALLQGYVDTVMLRDIVERHSFTQVAAVRWVIRHCLRNPAGAFSVHRLYSDLQSQGLGMARDQVHAILDSLTDAFLLSEVRMATESERQRNSNPRKIYPADQGLTKAFDTSGRTNLGHALETAVMHELERRTTVAGYVRAERGLEVDFLAIHPALGEELIQVCYDVSDSATLGRELRALDAAGRMHPHARKLLLVPDRSSVSMIAAEGINVQSAAEWALQSVDD